MNKQPKTQNSRSGFYATLALVGQVGFYIAAPLVAGAFIGEKIDGAFHNSTPFATLLGLLLGLVVGVVLVVRAVLQLPKN